MDPALSGKCVLLVEDNPGDARLIVEALRDAGSAFDLVAVETLAAALDALAAGGVDAVILDLGLPDSTGLETFTRLSEAAPAVPVIILSGLSDDRAALQAVSDGAQDFLVKGHVDGDTLVRCIGYAIGRKTTDTALHESEEGLRRTLEIAETVAELAKSLVEGHRSLEQIANLVLERAMTLTRSEIGYVSRVSPDSGEHRMLAAGELVDSSVRELADLAAERAFPLPEEGVYPHLWGISLNTRQPFLTNDPAAEESSGGTPEKHIPLRCYLSVPVITGESVAGQISVANREGGYSPADIETLERLAGLYAIAIVRQKEHEALLESEGNLRTSNEQLGRMIVDVAGAMGDITETRDRYTQGHQVRVAAIASAIAEEMGLPENDRAGIRMAGLLHDIGKLGVPAEILSKPGKLSDPEFALIKEHPMMGRDILAKVSFPWPIAEIVLQHHERCDGSGYPQGLTEEFTLLPARILAVSDVLEAMSSYRPYRPSLGPDAAIAEISEHPEKYCADVVKAAVALYERGGLEL